MSNIDDWLDLLGDEVTVEHFASLDAYGKATYGAPASFQARVDYRTHMVRDPSGEERVSSATAWIASSAKVSTRDRVTLSDGTQPPILKSALVWDEVAPLYVRLDLQ